MRLIGMLDSPYVRRVAVSMRLMKIDFQHEPLSVFRDYEQFSIVNPVVKAPTLVLDDGLVLMDSTLILQHLELSVPDTLSLTPRSVQMNSRSQRIVGLALAACEKTVQLVYEYTLRPSERRHEPWIERVRKQLCAAYQLLDREANSKGWLLSDRPLQADVSLAVAWTFTQAKMPDVIPPQRYPTLQDFCNRAETHPDFAATPKE